MNDQSNASEQTSAPRVGMLTISSEYTGQRLDNFLITLLKGVPKSHIYRILRKGEVRVNKGRVQAAYRLQEGDVVRIPPLRLAEPTATPSVHNKQLQDLEQRILYEDEQVIVVDKPAGMAVHGGSGISYGMIEALRQMRPQCQALELVHRLDRDTSGCLLLAKKRSALKSLHEQMREGKTTKIYLALVKGAWRGEARKIEVALRKNTLQSGERMVRVDHVEGKAATTLFSPEAVYARASLVRATLYTGRTHQIRVHAQHMGRPVAGDPKYGDAPFNKEMKTHGLKRLFLHAHILGFHLPGVAKQIIVTAPLAEELRQVLNGLEQGRGGL
ncbi:MAG: 23S rRNA pseudouridine(955/2504/2580) synthase RluC [Pseudomonadota bacterium]